MAKQLKAGKKAAKHRDYMREYYHRVTKHDADKLVRFRQKQNASRWMRDYGISAKDFANMLLDQAGRCAICDAPFVRKNEPHIDHDHQTGKVRGLLCNPCNTRLGYFEQAEWIRRAEAYVGGFF